MNMTDKILKTNAERLGLRDPSAIKKSETFLRILNSKPVAKTLTDVGKIIICLDLAATNLGVTFDKAAAIKLTGLRKGVYQNSLHTIETILNLDKPISVKDLCVQFDCMEAKQLAEDILVKYQEYDTKIKDINHPQYVAAAVYISCKIQKIKVDKSRFKLLSRLKPAQWNELQDEFEKFAVAQGLTNTKQCCKAEQPDKSDLNESIESPRQQIKSREVEIEDYEVWKERILKGATIQILHDTIKDN